MQMWLGGQTEFPKCTEGAEGVYDVSTFQKSRGGTSSPRGAKTPIPPKSSPVHPPSPLLPSPLLSNRKQSVAFSTSPPDLNRGPAIAGERLSCSPRYERDREREGREVRDFVCIEEWARFAARVEVHLRTVAQIWCVCVHACVCAHVCVHV